MAAEDSSQDSVAAQLREKVDEWFNSKVYKGGEEWWEKRAEGTHWKGFEQSVYVTLADRKFSVRIRENGCHYPIVLTKEQKFVFIISKLKALMTLTIKLISVCPMRQICEWELYIKFIRKQRWQYSIVFSWISG